VMGGIVLVGALGVHLGPALLGRGWVRVAGVAGSAACVVGILATGTRSAWVGAAVLVSIVLSVATLTLPKRQAVITFAAAILAVGVLFGAGWLVAGEQIAYRARAGVTELREAWEGRNLSSDMGARVRYARWAVEAIRERPVLGVGTGGYEHFVRKNLPAWGLDAAEVRIAPQAHNTALHAWATTGVVGLVLCAGVLISGAWMGFRRVLKPSEHRSRRAELSAWLGTYGAGPTVGLIGIAIMSAFDVPYVNIQPAAFTSALLALCVAGAVRTPDGR